MERLVIKYWDVYPAAESAQRTTRFETLELGSLHIIGQSCVPREAMILIEALADGARIDQIFSVWDGPHLLGWSAFQYLIEKDDTKTLNVVAAIGQSLYTPHFMRLLVMTASYKRCSHITAKFIFPGQWDVLRRLGWREVKAGVWVLPMIADAPTDPCDGEIGPGWNDVREASYFVTPSGKEES